MDLTFSELARISEVLLTDGLSNPGPLTLVLIFFAGLITSLSACSLSLLPITVAYLAGFKVTQNPFKRSTIFCSGIILSLVILGSLSGLLGNIFGKVPFLFTKLVAIVAVLMGLNLLGIINFKLPEGPDPNNWTKKVPKPLAPLSAGLAFGLAASPCTTPVLAVLLAWIAKTENLITGILVLAFFGLGQVIPLIIAGTFAASIPNLLNLRPMGKFIPIISGTILLTIGLLNLLSQWI